MSSKIKPFHPNAFPPRQLSKSSFASTLKKANNHLAKYNAFLQQSPSPQRLFSGLIDLESIASVQSQRVKTDVEELLCFLNGKHKKKNPKLQLASNYRDALIWACKNRGKSPLSKELICKIQKKAKHKTTLPMDAGAYRNRQNWIGAEGCTIEEAYFYPPAASEVEGLMKELLRYAKKKEKEPLLQIALFFAQLLIIHPFMDGNGRAARILIPIFLCQKRVLSFPLLMMSRYFQKYRLRYFHDLFQLREANQWEEWVLFFLKGVIYEIKKTMNLLEQILALYHQILQKQPDLKKETVLFLFENPVFSSLKDSGALAQLRKGKFIEKGTDRLYRFSPLLKLLNPERRSLEVQKRAKLI
jgi:Fic family protein